MPNLQQLVCFSVTHICVSAGTHTHTHTHTKTYTYIYTYMYKNTQPIHIGANVVLRYSNFVKAVPGFPEIATSLMCIQYKSLTH